MLFRSDEIMRLGDIVHSTPTAVSKPIEAFDLIEGDLSYTAFRKRYKNRRQVVYVGGNDGMIHALNAGFFDAGTKTFEQTGADGGALRLLGTEIWAYIPKNLLPHLQWSARKDYSHVYYVDNGIRTFEAKMFPADGDHPNGWGTLLVATMALGGGSDATGITIDTQGDGLGAANTDNNTRDDVKTKSAVVLMDVTNPELPPKVLAELTPPNLQFTTSKPQVVSVATPNGGGPNKWFLVLGSGPSDLGSVSYVSGVGVNQQFASMFVYDLANLNQGLDNVAVTALNGLVRPPIPLTTPNVFFGDLTAADFNFNLRTDAVYFGTVGASSDDNAADQGSLFRLSVGEATDPTTWIGPFQLVTNLNEPFADPPSLAFDARERRWLVAASGRYQSGPDRSTQRQQKLIGIIDKNPDGTGGVPANPLSPQLNLNNLVNVSNARVFSDGGISFDGSTTSSTTFSALADSIVTAGGWQRNFVTAGGQPAERGVSGVTIASGVAFVPSFTPGILPCTSEGSSILYGLSFLTGTAIPESVFGQIPCNCNDGRSESPPIPFKHSGAGNLVGDYTPDRQTGQMQGASVFGTNGGAGIGSPGTGSRGKVCTNNSTAAISCENANLVNSTRNGETSWREHRDEQ